jgi:RNA polymerase sigma-70 factor (ECF subfamily)
MVSDGNISDQFLSRQIANGREEAFDFIFRKHYRALCAQALIYIKDDDLAQSIVQDCFVSFWEKRNELKDVRNIRSYLSFMVRNKAVDHFRRIEKEQKAFSAVKGEEGTESVEMQAISKEFEEILMDTVSKLPERCRVAFEYSRFEGLKYSEIAEKMNISVKAVEALMGRSLKILRTELSDYLPFVFLFLDFLKKS